MDNKLFHEYTSDFFKQYTIVPWTGRSGSARRLKIDGYNIHIDNMSSTDFMKYVVPMLLKKEGKSCNELIKHIDRFILYDKTFLPRSYPPRFLQNFQNSCVVDSIIFIIFFANHSFFMNKILHSEKTETDVGKNFKAKILPELSDLYINNKKWTGTIQNIQSILFPFIKAISYGEINSCGDIKSGLELWDLFANAFTDLQFEYLSERAEELGNKPVMSTYLDFKIDDLPYSQKAEFLIYGDDEKPKIQSLLEIGHDLQVGDYELTAVLFFKGMGHYTSAINTISGWVYYDDLRNQIPLIKDPRDFIFNESVNHKVQMLFYKRIVHNIDNTQQERLATQHRFDMMIQQINDQIYDILNDQQKTLPSSKLWQDLDAKRFQLEERREKLINDRMEKYR